MRKRIALLLALVIGASIVGILLLRTNDSAATARNQIPPQEADCLIKSLLSIKTGDDGKVTTIRYGEDGAADWTVTLLADNSRSKTQVVKTILNMKENYIPFLINHLDDCRQSNLLFVGGAHSESEPFRVPVGFLCLDLLVHIVKPDPPMFYSSDSQDDGLGASWGVNDGYYFRPDDYVLRSEKLVDSDIVRVVKKNWLAALRDGKLRCAVCSQPN